MTTVGLTGSALLGIAIWFGALLLLLLVTGFWVIERIERLRERRRHPNEAAATDGAASEPPAIPALRAGRPAFHLGPLRRYLGQGRVNPVDRGGAA
ncbi:MAG: hypothetical protein KDB94_00115 [Acidobacteria bacterium]|nr:hypothetical protein [Acidobacteriota bacterium]